MKKYILTSILMLICSNIFSQRIYNKEYERVYIEVGFLQPLGNLNNQFDASIDFGFWFRTKIEATKCFDLGFNIYVPKNSKPFNFKYSDSVFKLKPSGFSGMLGIKYCKIFPISNHKKKINIEWINSFGVAFIFYPPDDERYYDIKNGTTKDKDGKNKSYTNALTTINLAEGFMFNVDNIGVQVQYQFTPFSTTNDKLDSNFGSQSLIFGMVYRQ
jgi:hypothetical protein